MTATSIDMLATPQRQRSLASTLALVVVALVGMRIDVTYGTTVGGLAAFALLPVWLPWLLKNKWGLALTSMGLLAVLSGVILSLWSSVDHGTTLNDELTRSMRVLQLLAILGAMLWSHRIAGISQTCLAFAVGCVVGIPLNISSDPNLWRFTLSIPLGILVLTLVSMQRSLWLQFIAVGGLALIGVMNDSRSNAAFLLLAALAILWQRLRGAPSRKTRGLGGLATLVGVGFVVFYLLQSAILEGYFGEATQERTAAQIDRSGSVLLGGRPEIAASFALIVRYPFGLGSGITANYSDIVAAKSAMLSIGYDPNNGYVERFMFGSGIELHSVIGDLWLWFGLAGLAIAVIMIGVILTGLVRALAVNSVSILFVYLVARFFWDLAYSPVTSTMRLWPIVASLAIAYASYAIRPAAPQLQSLFIPSGTIR